MSGATDARRVAELSELTGHDFAAPERLTRALTHASANAALRNGQAAGDDYQRLEFLGDRVLGLVIAELLMQLYPLADEGELSVRLNALVNADICAEMADRIGITPHIITGPEIARASAAKLVNLRADVMEAVIATVYLDGGMDAARRFIRRFWTDAAKLGAKVRRDPKTELQEWAHRAAGAVPAYRVVGRDGPDHAPHFTVEVTIGSSLSARGEGTSKRDAERAAASRILVQQGVWDQ